MKPGRSKRFLNLVVNKTSDDERLENLIPSLIESPEHNAKRQLSIPSSPLPEGAEENYEAFRDILEDDYCDANKTLEPLAYSSCALTGTNDLIEPRMLTHFHGEPISDQMVAASHNNSENFNTNIAYVTNFHSFGESTMFHTFLEPSHAPTEAIAPLSMTPRTSPISFSAAANKMQPSPFTIDPTLGFENSPIPRVDDDVVFDLLNIPTPMPSPLNSHSRNKCNDEFCCLHEACKNYITTFKEHQSRKRTQDNSKWPNVQRKNRTKKDKTFVNRKGNLAEQKTLRSPCSCRLNCSRSLPETERQAIFTKFWGLSSREKQWLFITRYTNKGPKKRCLNVPKPNNRKFSFNYFLPLVSEKSKKIKVCKTMFLNTLVVSGKTLVTAWKKYDGTSAIEADKRGQHTKHKKVLVDEMVRSVCDHVRAFVPVESHYLRKKTSKLYLDGSLSITRMFTMYKEWYDPGKYSVKAQTVRQYRDIVNFNFNLSFFCPKKDQCDICQTYNNILQPTEEQRNSFQEHQKRKKIARALKHKNKNEAIQSGGSTVCAVFDSEKILTCPLGQDNIFYYKKKLSCFYFTIFNMGQQRAACYMWDETVAKCGANEVSSCLIDFIAANANKGATEFVFWSDNCWGHNRNRFIYSSYIYAAMKHKVSITHRFMETGHTQNEGDIIHSTIEYSSRTRKVYTPSEWILFVRWAESCSKSHYTVQNMTQKHFYDFKEQMCEKVWNKNIYGEKVKWNSIKEIHVNVEAPNKLLYKYDLSSKEYDTIIVAGSTRNSSSNKNLTRAYWEPLAIPLDKYTDLMSMCKTNDIPKEHHKYFENLPHTNNNVETNQDAKDETEVFYS